jgi:hypothetical protein
VLTTEYDFTPGIREYVMLSRIRRFAECDERIALGTAHGDGAELFPTLSTRPTSLVAVLDFLEHEFGINVSNCEINEENFGSIRAIARFAASKQPFAVG